MVDTPLAAGVEFFSNWNLQNLESDLGIAISGQRSERTENRFFDRSRPVKTVTSEVRCGSRTTLPMVRELSSGSPPVWFGRARRRLEKCRFERVIADTQTGDFPKGRNFGFSTNSQTR